MLPILVSVDGTLPVFEPPDSFEPEWLVPADPTFTGGANYVIYNTVNGKRYEGETVNFKNRHYMHLHTMNNKDAKYHNNHLYKSMRKYRIENFRFYFRQTFKFEGREKLSDTERKAFYKKFKDTTLYPCETYWIQRLGLLDDSKGYNMKESGEGGEGHKFTEKTKAKISLAVSKPVTRCEIIQDYGLTQKVRLTSYMSSSAAAIKTGVNQGNISMCCLNHEGFFSRGGYIWWFTKETDIFGEDIIVPRVGNVPGTSQNHAVISVLPLGNGLAVEQWHNGMNKAARELSQALSKKFHHNSISACCLGKSKFHHGHNFRRVTTEKKEDFVDNKRIAKYEAERYKITKKRKRN